MQIVCTTRACTSSAPCERANRLHHARNCLEHSLQPVLYGCTVGTPIELLMQDNNRTVQTPMLTSSKYSVAQRTQMPFCEQREDQCLASIACVFFSWQRQPLARGWHPARCNKRIEQQSDQTMDIAERIAYCMRTDDLSQSQSMIKVCCLHAQVYPSCPPPL